MFIENYTGGILGSDDDPKLLNTTHTHGVSIVGWGYDKTRDKQHWIIRNSWGQYWGEMGFFRVEMGLNLLGIESHLAWATPDTYTTWNFPCDEQGSNCEGQTTSVTYLDPSKVFLKQE